MRETRLALVVMSLISCACITDFERPLGPSRESFIDPALLGAWTCTEAHDPSPGVVSIEDFDGRQYSLQITEEGTDEPVRGRAVATQIADTMFLSVHEVGPRASGGWTYLEYSMTDATHLRLRTVDPNQFEDVLHDADALRQRLAERLQDPEAFVGSVSCTPRDAEQP